MSTLYALKDEFNTIPYINDDITDQYKTFLQSEITQFNPTQMYLLDNYNISNITTFLDKQSTTQLNISPSDNDIINTIYNVPLQYCTYIDTLLNLKCKINIFNQIKDIDGSIVMIGANGSGKSTFSRQLNGKLSSNIVILSAQHFLYYNKRDTISATGNELQKVHDFQFNPKLGNNNFQDLITSDMDDLINALLSQHTDCTYRL